MNLDALLAPLPDRNVTLPCKVGRILETLEDPYKSALIKLLDTDYDNGGLSAEQLEHRMKQAGLEVGATVLRRHRKKQCGCTA